ncbi:MAG: TetR/AcrR family transcriptional regulator [Bacillota bacterium]|nr:TetR/AcrR family transcriptional regulator [Bacillota bacterium]
MIILSRAYKKDRPTRELIVQSSMRLFLEQGYSETSCARIAQELGISPGNLTFYFPTKEHLLSELVEEFCVFQGILMSRNLEEDSGILFYCMELAIMAGLCEQSLIARDFYISAYTHPRSLELIRKKDSERAEILFGKYCPEFTSQDFVITENIVSGIEYGMLISAANAVPFLWDQLSRSLESVLKLYRVPEEIRYNNIKKAMDSDYREIGTTFLEKFMRHVEKTNAAAVSKALGEKNSSAWQNQ